MKRTANTILILIFLLSFCLHGEALAARSSAGGGDLAESGGASTWIGIGAGVASMGLGTAFNSGMQAGINGANGLNSAGTLAVGAKDAFGNIAQAGTFTEGFSNSITNFASIQGFTSSLAATTALTQVNNFAGAAGNYYGWDPKVSIFTGAVLGGMVSGGMNPGQFGSSVYTPDTYLSSAGLWEINPYGAFNPTWTQTFNGVALGAVQGTIAGAIEAPLANSKGQLEPWVGPVAGLAGGFGTSMLVGGFTPGNMNSDISVVPRLEPKGAFSFGNDFIASNAFGNALSNTVSSIPYTAFDIGFGYATKNMDYGDRFIASQASTGLRQAVGTLWEIPDMEKYASFKADQIAKQQPQRLWGPVNNPFIQGNGSGLQGPGARLNEAPTPSPLPTETGAALSQQQNAEDNLRDQQFNDLIDVSKYFNAAGSKNAPASGAYIETKTELIGPTNSTSGPALQSRIGSDEGGNFIGLNPSTQGPIDMPSARNDFYGAYFPTATSIDMPQAISEYRGAYFPTASPMEMPGAYNQYQGAMYPQASIGISDTQSGINYIMNNSSLTNYTIDTNSRIGGN